MASNVCTLHEHDASYGSSKLQVTILASEWRSSKGGLSTINRELAIQLAKFSCLEVTFFLPKCSDEDKKEADSHGIYILKAGRLPGYNELDWLSFPPEHLRIDVVVGHGVKLGRQALVIRKSHKCKWVQVVHTDPEELGMFKCYESPFATGKEKHHIQVELCQLADFVVGVGPKLTGAYRRYLSMFEKGVFEFTPGVFTDFCSIQQIPTKRKECSVLVFGHGDSVDFKQKGFDFAARSIAVLPDTLLVFVGAPHGKKEEIVKHFVDFGIPENRLRVRGYMEQEALKRLFCEVDLVLMPSRTEGFGLTGLEALSAGLPVIVSKNSGFGEALESVPFGSSFVIDSEDPSAWTAAIKDILNKDRKSRLDEVKVLRDFYGERYSWSKQCQHLIKKMLKLLDGLCLCVPPKRKRGIERNESEQPAGHSPPAPPKRRKGIEKNDTEQPAARTSCPSHVIEWIRNGCQKREGVIFPVPWCQELSFQIKDIFTRLRIVAKEKTRGIVTSKEVTSMTSIFTPHEGCEQPVIVFIEGEPGLGKTTYCQKLAYDWASKQCHEWDESFPRIDVLLLLRCREIKSTIWDAVEDQILPEGIEPEAKNMFFQFLKENPSKMLLVLDEFDEADPQTLEMCLKLIQGKQLPGCHIVITSRHEAGSKVRPYTDTLLEIVGFTTTDAECYIRKFFQHSEHLAEALISKVQFHKDLMELTRSPLNTLLLCVVFEDLEGILPNNRTQLYVEIVLFILRRYEYKNGLSSRGKDLLLVYKEELMILGRSALDSLRKGDLYFEDHKGDIKKHLLTKFGFLSIQSGGSKRAPCDRYGFFHKTFQEFFSGYFLAFSVIDDVANFHSFLTDETYMGELLHVFKFMSGFVAQKSEETAVSIVRSIASIVNETGHTYGKYDSYLWLAHLLIKECKSYSAVLNTKLARIFGESLDLVDMVVRHVLSRREDEIIGTFFQALAFNSTVTNLKLLEWAFSTEATNLLAQALTANTSLSSLGLSSNSIGAEGANSLAQALRVNTSLSSLDLSSNSIVAEGANSLAQVLRVNTSLSSLALSSNSIGAEGANSFARALRVNTSLSSLDLSSNSIGAEGANSLARALRVNTSLCSLDLSSNSIGAEGANSLAETLRVNTSLSYLDLTSNSIGAGGANSLAEALRVNTSLSSLDLSSNFIGTEGAISLAQALKVNTSLSSLDLPFNFIDDEAAISLAQALSVNTSLSSIDLSANSIGAEGAISLAQSLTVNTSIFSLYLSSNFIDDEPAISLAQALRVNTSLCSLDLSANYIGAEGANSLAQALRVNNSLSSLNLSASSIGDEEAISLANALRVNTSLSSLDLSVNAIGDEGAHSLAQALRVNSSVSSLDLTLNLIGAKGAISLSEALRLNYHLSVLY